MIESRREGTFRGVDPPAALRRRPRLARALVIAAVLSVAGTVALWAQAGDVPGEPRPLAPADIEDLDAREQIRLSVSGLRLEGAFGGADESGLSFDTGSEVRTIPYTAIDTLWVRGNSAGSGAWIGAGVLGIGGGLLLGAANQGLCDAADCGGKFAAGFGLGLLVGAPVGALVGAGLGLAVPKWHRRHP